MVVPDQQRFPGGEIVLPGIEDLNAGRRTAEGEAVLMAAGRLREAGLDIPPEPDDAIPAAHRLYALVAAEDPRGAHSRYNAILGRVVSFARAAERARAR